MTIDETLKKEGYFKKEDSHYFIGYSKKRMVGEHLFEHEFYVNKYTKEIFFYSIIDYKEDTEIMATPELLKIILRLIEEL